MNILNVFIIILNANLILCESKLYCNNVTIDTNEAKINGIKLNRIRRQDNDMIKNVVDTIVDLLINNLKSSLNSQSGIINTIRPYLISGGITLINELIKLAQAIMVQRPLFDINDLKEKSYAAYPVFIPQYGSFILLSEVGKIEQIKEKSKVGEMAPMNNKTEEFSSDDAIENSAFQESDDDNNDDEENVKYETGRDVKENDFYLGDAHLIPMIDNPDVFEKSRNVESVGKLENDLVQEYIKVITGDRSGIRSIKKRLILAMLKKVQLAIRSL